MSDHRKRIDRVTTHIRGNLASDLSLDALADVAALSRFHFHRVFRAVTGETLAEAVRRERLNRAGVLIGMTGRPVAAIARDCGFADADALGRAARATWGVSPRELRAKHLVPPAVAAPGLATPNRGDPSMTDVTIRHDAPAQVAALPHRGPYGGIGRTFSELGPRLGAAGIAPVGPAYGIYYDMPGQTPDDQLRAHAGVEVAPGAAMPPGFDRIEMAGGRMAVLIHRGPYEGIPGAWDAIYRWLEASDETEGDSPPFERYLNDMGEVAPADLVTEICVPLRG